MADGDVGRLMAAMGHPHPGGRPSPLQSDYARRLVAESVVASGLLAAARLECEMATPANSADRCPGDECDLPLSQHPPGPPCPPKPSPGRRWA